MSVPIDSSARQNRLLAALSDEAYQRLVPHLELVSLLPQQILYQAGEPITHVYFPHRSVISLINLMEDGSTIEVGLVGREGMVGLPVILGDANYLHQAFVQIGDRAMRIRAEVLKAEFNRGGALQTLLLRYVQALLTQVSQSAACNRFHTIEERLARQLLLIQDALQSQEFLLTQESLAQMLGARRSGVTVAAGTLSQAGMIRYARGRIFVLDREGLEATACECYRVIRDEFDRLLNPR
jgi:CRP-like cAMP-binding protein